MVDDYGKIKEGKNPTLLAQGTFEFQYFSKANFHQNNI